MSVLGNAAAMVRADCPCSSLALALMPARKTNSHLPLFPDATALNNSCSEWLAPLSSGSDSAPLFRSPDGRNGGLEGITSDDLRLGAGGVFAVGFPSMSFGGVGVNSRQPGRLWSVYTSLPSWSEHTHVPATEAPPRNNRGIATAQAVLRKRYFIHMRIVCDSMVSVSFA